MGGNKATNSQVMNETYEYYEERLNQLISYIKMENAECDIFICNVCPRRDKKMLELINGNTQPEKVAELVMDAFNLLSLNIKLTNMNKLERVKRSYMQSMCHFAKRALQPPSCLEIIFKNKPS